MLIRLYIVLHLVHKLYAVMILQWILYFNYEKTVKGYNNTATYIMKYEEDLLLKEAPVMKVMQKSEEKE